MFGLDGLLNLGGKILDKVLPDATAREAAKAELAKQALSGQLETMRTEMSVMLAEAQSADPWTSRARPSFLYVVYVFILAAIPMGVVSAIRPESATAIAAGAKAWLDAIPGDLWMLFGVGYLGYSASRTIDKFKGNR